MVQHLPAGSPATFYCIHSLVEKANQLSSEVFTHEADAWKQWQAEPEPSKKLLDLLLRLVFLVDIQVRTCFYVYSICIKYYYTLGPTRIPGTTLTSGCEQ